MTLPSGLIKDTLAASEVSSSVLTDASGTNSGLMECWLCLGDRAAKVTSPRDRDSQHPLLLITFPFYQPWHVKHSAFFLSLPSPNIAVIEVPWFPPSPPIFHRPVKWCLKKSDHTQNHTTSRWQAIQLTFTEHLLCARQCAKYWGYNNEPENIPAKVSEGRKQKGHTPEHVL